jgi:ATPase subunit of ABC transporter with duplicated ATPase domains
MAGPHRPHGDCRRRGPGWPASWLARSRDAALLMLLSAFGGFVVRVHLEGLSFGYDSAIDVLGDASLALEPGWTGVVGENGCGKSTLLALIAGRLTPTRGRVRREPKDARVVYCPQEVEALDGAVRGFTLAWDKASLAWQARLGLDPGDVDRWPTLSAGERKRWQIGAALARAPEVLLLDEPTNHLDAEGRSMLLGALRAWRGVGLLVSHDRRLLDALTERTARLHRGELVLYPGGYGAARPLWLAERAGAEERAARAERALRAERARLASERRRHDAAKGALPTRARAKGPRDSDARSMARKFAAQKAEARLGRGVAKQGRAVAHAAVERDRHRLTKERGGAIALGHQGAARRWLCRLECERLRAGTRVLARDLSLAIERTSRVRIAGPNGAGKSTLLTHLVQHAPDRTSLLVVPQELDRAQRLRLIHEARALPPDARGRLLQLAASLGLDPERAMASEGPSPGEARKLLIAGGLARRVAGIFLDEPTNHLDLPSIERLEGALAAFPGALVLISHDDAFAEALTDTTWHLADGHLEILR